MALRQSIPVINLSVFRSAAYTFSRKNLAADQLRQIKALHEAFYHYGFAYVVGVDKALVSSRTKVLRQATRFFGLPPAEKMSLELNRDFRGYQPLEVNVTGGVPDKHEALDFMRELEPNDVIQSVLCGKNQWPTLGDFRQDYIEYIRHMNVLGDLVLKATGFGATGDENVFAKYCSDPFWVLRAIRYPPVETLDRQGCGEHTDYGCLTFIADNGVANCVQCRNGASGTEWMDLQCPEEGYIVNIGDALANWSDGLYKATPHRVLAPSANQPSRISVCFFYEPNHNAVIDTGEKGTTYGEHLQAKCASNFVAASV